MRRILKKWALVAFAAGLGLSIIGWLSTSEAVSEFTTLLGIVVLFISGVLAFMLDKQVDKPTSDNEG